MSPAAGGAAPTQPAAASFAPAPAPTAAIGAPHHPQENIRDPAAQAEGGDPGNAATRKTAWNVPPPPPPSAVPVGGGIMGGEESWPALAESAAGRAWPKSASSDSLRSLSDGSAPSAPEDLIVPSVSSQPVSNPISTAPISSPASVSPPPSATTMAPSPQKDITSQPDLVRYGGGHGDSSGEGGHGGNHGGGSHGGNSGVGSHGDNNGGGSHGGNGGGGGRGENSGEDGHGATNGGGGGGSGSTRSGNNSSDGNSSSGGDGNWNDGGHTGGSYLNSSVHSGSIGSIGGSGGSGIESNRRVFGSNNWSGNDRGGGGSYNNGNGDEGSRNNGGSRGGHWNNNGRHGSGSSNGFGGRGGRNRRDHDRGGNFSPRNYSRASPVQQQQPSFYQPGQFQRPPPPPPAAHFMVPQPFVPYVPPFAHPADVQGFPFYVPPVEQQFQNMHLVQQPMQHLGAQQDQLSLQYDIQHQIEHYFSTDNLCHDTYLRGRMDDQGWVPIDLIAGFPMLTRFRMLGVDTNYILDSIRGSDLLEVQGNNIRRRNDWAAWILRRGPPPSN